MTISLASVEAVYLVSVLKPVVFVLTLLAWGWLVPKLSKDAGYYYLKQLLWNSAHVGAAVLGFALMLWIPFFWGGWVVGMLIAAAPMVGYVFYRNRHVPEERRWQWTLDQLTGRIDEYQQQRAQELAELKLLKHDEEELPVPTGADEYFQAHQWLAELVEFALSRGGDQIDVRVTSKEAALSVRVDGVSYARRPSAPDATNRPQTAMRLVDYVKKAADLDVSDRRKKQGGKVLVDSEAHGRHTLVVETGGSTKSVKLAMQVDPSELANRSFKDLGLLDSQKQALEAALEGTGKVFLVASPPQQGRTTTAYALLQEHDPYIQGVQTLEDEQPFDAEGVNHNFFDAGASAEQMREQLAGILRRDPNVLLVSRVPDQDAAQLIARSAEEIRFYLPLAAEDGFAALKAWLRMVGDRKLAARALGGVTAQRLVRTLCPTCRRPYTPDESAVRKLNLPKKVTKLYQASGKVMVKDQAQVCPNCKGLGYRGRTGVFEVLPMDAQARAFIASGETDKVRAHLRKQKVLWLQEAGLAKVVSGETDVKEVTRVFASGSGRTSKSASSQTDSVQGRDSKAEASS